jgi:hypothetical protein
MAPAINAESKGSKVTVSNSITMVPVLVPVLDKGKNSTTAAPALVIATSLAPTEGASGNKEAIIDPKMMQGRNNKGSKEEDKISTNEDFKDCPNYFGPNSNNNSMTMALTLAEALVLVGGQYEGGQHE